MVGVKFVVPQENLVNALQAINSEDLILKVEGLMPVLCDIESGKVSIASYFRHSTVV